MQREQTGKERCCDRKRMSFTSVLWAGRPEPLLLAAPEPDILSLSSMWVGGSDSKLRSDGPPTGLAERVGRAGSVATVSLYSAGRRYHLNPQPNLNTQRQVPGGVMVIPPRPRFPHLLRVYYVSKIKRVMMVGDQAAPVLPAPLGSGKTKPRSRHSKLERNPETQLRNGVA